MIGGPFVALDRDGTLIEERHYLSTPDDLVLIEGVPAALRALRDLGYGLVVVTNQSGLARGHFGEATLHRIHERLHEALAAEGAFLDGIFVCPHHPDDGCSCRKPGIGLIRQIQQELGLDPSSSVMVGDKECDLGVGQAAGMRRVLVRTGYGRKEEATTKISPDLVVEDLWEFAEIERGGRRASDETPAGRMGRG